MLKRIALVVSVAALIGLLIWLPSHRRPVRLEPRPLLNVSKSDSSDKRDQLGSIGRKLGDLLAEGSTFRQSDKEGRPLFEVSGEHIANRPEKEELRISKARATVFEKGSPAVLFDSNEVTVRYGKGRERIVFSGKVQIESKTDRAKLSAGEVHYNPSTKRIEARRGIRFERSDLTTECPQLVADTTLRMITFKGPIRGRFTTRHGL